MAIVSSNISSRVSNRLNMLPRLSSTRLYDNYLSNNVYDKIIEVKYSPCNKFYRYAIIPNINLENFLKNIKLLETTDQIMLLSKFIMIQL